MNIWRVKSKTGKTVHFTHDGEKTFCGRKVGDNWQFLFLLNDRTEALEYVDNLCEKCNKLNLEEWEEEYVDGEPVAKQEASEGDGEEADGATEKSDAKSVKIESEVEKPEVKSVRGIRV